MDIPLSDWSPDSHGEVLGRRAGERLHTPAGPMRANKGHVTPLRAEPF